jgi:hypothetical protein
MQTVHCTCGHCGNLMAVGQEYLGQQVRCPHCQQVVLAPTPAPAGVPAPSPAEAPGLQPFTFSPNPEADSIFTPPEHHDDLFDDPSPPTIEMPPEPAPPPPAAVPQPGTGPTFPSTGAEATVLDPTAHPVLDRTEVLEPPHDWSAPAEEARPDQPAAEPDRSAPRPGARRPSEGASSTATILIFLVPYAIFMTVVALYFYYQSRQVKHPLEYLPDYPAENPGTTRKGGGKVSSIFHQQKVDVDLPGKLRVPLHGTIRIGALEVTPEKVEKTHVVFLGRFAPQRAGPESLLLTLRLRNVSADQVFYPTDPAFNARWETGQPKPYSFLEVGAKRFFGGPIPWENHGKKPGGKPARTEYLQGQEQDNQPLGPDEQRATVIATNPDDKSVLASVNSSKGPFLWRVRLRRGLVQVNDREIPASAVIGVEFSPNDIH